MWKINGFCVQPFVRKTALGFEPLLWWAQHPANGERAYAEVDGPHLTTRQQSEAVVHWHARRALEAA